MLHWPSLPVAIKMGSYSIGAKSCRHHLLEAISKLTCSTGFEKAVLCMEIFVDLISQLRQESLYQYLKQATLVKADIFFKKSITLSSDVNLSKFSSPKIFLLRQSGKFISSKCSLISESGIFSFLNASNVLPSSVANLLRITACPFTLIYNDKIKVWIKYND